MMSGLALVSCKQDSDSSNKTYEKRMRTVPPKLVMGKIYWGEKAAKKQNERDAEQIMVLLRTLLTMVDQRNIKDLPALISRERGLWTDLKTHRSYAQIVEQVEKPGGYIRTFFLDSEKLRKHTGDERSLAVRDVLRYTDTLRADFFLEADNTVEVRLILEQYPPYNYHLNHPVFVKEADGWKLLRLF